MSQPCLRASLKLAAVTVAIAYLAACSGSSTAPTDAAQDMQRLAPSAAAKHDGISDSLAVCLGGYIIIGGRMMCAGS